MHPPGAHQTFGLGSLVGPHGTTAPSHVTVEVEGRGVFAKVKLSFDFDGAQAGSESLFLMEKPFDAVASAIVINGQPAPPLSGGREPKSLSASQLQSVEQALAVPSSHLLVVEISADIVLSHLAFEFILAVDLQWHRGAFHFRSPEGPRQVAFNGRWELSGLPGAGIAFSGAASGCRLETLEGARHRWSEPLKVTPEEPGVVEFSLDEKKAASIAVFSPSAPDNSGLGCAAVAVVAPVRPQLAREPVRLAILVEVRNPQEGLLVRSMVEKVTTLLKTQDEFCVLLLGTDTPSALVSWSSSETVDDDVLAKLIEPTNIGRAPDLWGNLQSLGSHLRTSTHVLVATSGASAYPPKGLASHVPVFVFATGRRPFKSQLESLSQRSGGFLMEGTAESLDSLLERMRIRLSPPLLSDFKLEGWALDQLRPSGATQVYTDQPTLVLGLYEGLLPKTVTLSGQSPSRQKLAQRVKVETLQEIDLMPLYRDRVARWDGENVPVDLWLGDGTVVRNISHSEALPWHYYAPEPSTIASDNTMGIEMVGEPAISLSATMVEFQESFLGAPAAQPDSFFSEESSIFSQGSTMFDNTSTMFGQEDSTMKLSAPAAFDGVATFEGTSSFGAEPSFEAAPAEDGPGFEQQPSFEAGVSFEGAAPFEGAAGFEGAASFEGPPTFEAGASLEGVAPLERAESYAGSPSFEEADSFEGAAAPASGEADLFYSEPSEHSSSMGSPVIRKAEVIDDSADGEEEEVDLFENPSELSSRLPALSRAEAAFDVPSGRPTITKEAPVDDEEQDPHAEVEPYDGFGSPPAPPKAPEPSPQPVAVAPPAKRADSSSSMEDPSGKRRLVSWRQRQETEAPAVPISAPVGPREASVGWSSNWLESFQALPEEAAREWLEGCSIDQLGLAASLLDAEIVEDLLGRLSPLRRRAVRTQVELGRLLDGYECEEADRLLSLALTEANI